MKTKLFLTIITSLLLILSCAKKELPTGALDAVPTATPEPGE